MAAGKHLNCPIFERHSHLIGHETTAGLLTLTLHTLAANPESQARLRRDILETIPTNENLTFSSVESLGYLSNVAKEVLRLYPPGEQ
jgi:cytochrome P450